MANTQKTRFSYAVVDELGTHATIALYALVDPATTVAQLANTQAAVVTDLKAVLGAGIEASGIHLEMSESDTVTAGSRAEQTAVLDYNVPASGRQAGIALAGWLDSLVGAGGAPTIGSGAGATLVAALTGALPGTATGERTNNAFQALGDLVDAFLSFRKRRKQLSRSSEEVAP